MPGIHAEGAFEEAIEQHLENTGYIKGDPEAFDRAKCLDTNLLLEFIQETQPKEWEYLKKIQGEKTKETLLNDLCKSLDSDHQGCLDVLRHGFKCYGKTFRVAFFAPASGLNPDTKARYEANRLTVTRQLHYSLANENSIDIVLSLNGLPLVTAELKNPLTGQTWANAIKQYKYDRDPKELIFKFKRRTLVHFAVDPDQVHMTTKLEGKNAFFLPFNKGDNGGKGNPLNPDGFKTAYLWEEVWQRDSLLDIIQRFIHLDVTEKKLGNKKIKKERMIFPRYHQLQAVRELVFSSREEGPGSNYLIQHSAGSGKSNSIAWLAHRLATLYTEEDEKVFDSVVVVTDRLVLDQQLQNTIYQFEHRHGVVQKIDEDSTQLAEALSSAVPIIITTLQKFPFVTEKMGELPSRKYAVIIDEAHSSQGGQTAAEMKKVLAGAEVAKKAKEDGGDDLPDHEEEILKTIAARGKQTNLSFFAFTATPKYKTLEVFGRPGTDGKPQAFHLYSMKQAIEEGFILDVLKHYTTYATYYGLIKKIEDDPEIDKKKAAKALARFMSLHPYNIAQKTEVIIEHFRKFSMHKIGGKAKAMVVASSRLHAVKYKVAFDKYIKEKGYSGIKTLVAFSGTVRDPNVPGVEYTEVSMNNGLKEKELPEAFGGPEYQVLLVAEKYQTGFDQPLLHTMYVDKRLAGIQAVQTLSRVNRTHPGKEDTFVLDFVNKPEDILEAFKPYYEKTLVGEQSDHAQLYEIKARLDSSGVYHENEVEEFSRIFYKPKSKQSSADSKRINACLDPAVERFKGTPEEEREELRTEMVAYRSLYSFLSQIIPFGDSDLEKLYSYIRSLLNKLPRRDLGPPIDLDGDVILKYYRIEKTHDAATIDLEGGGVVDGPTETGTGHINKETIALSELVDILNDRFGTEFKKGDQVFFDQIKEEAIADSEIQQAALVNTLENFGYVFDKALENLFVSRMEKNEDLTAMFFNNKDINRTVFERLKEDVYDEIRKTIS